MGRSELEYLYIVEGKGTREIASLLGVSQPTAGKILAANGIRLRGKRENKMPVPRGSKLSESHKAAIAAAHLGKRMGYGPGDNPRWIRQEVACENCGRIVWKKRCHLAKPGHRFCGKQCHAVWLSKQGTAHHAYKGGPVEVACLGCGKRLYRRRWQIAKGDRFFCSQKCNGLWKASNLTGDKVYNWKGGYEPYYGPTWLKAKRTARQRDGYICQRCGKTQAELGRALDVHHVIPFRNFGLARYAEANALSNLVSYCNRCHKLVESESESASFEQAYENTGPSSLREGETGSGRLTVSYLED